MLYSGSLSTGRDTLPMSEQAIEDAADIKVKAKLTADIADLESKIADAHLVVGVAKDKEDAALALERKAWRALEKAGEPTSGPKYDAWNSAFRGLGQAQQAHGSAFDRLRYLERELANLRHPRELERRLDTRRRLDNVRALTRERKAEMATETKTPRAKKTPKPNAKSKGVPDAYLAENGNFKPGMDARYKSDLILAILEQPNPKALVTVTADEAQKQFAKFPQWAEFLKRKREILAEKTEAKEKAAAERAERTKARAAEKKEAKATSTAKLEEQMAEAEAEHRDAAKQEVTPDPKPVRQAKARRK